MTPQYRPLCALYITGRHTVCFTDTEQMRRIVLYLETVGHEHLMEYMLSCVAFTSDPEARVEDSPTLVDVMLREMLRSEAMGVIDSPESFRRLSSFQLILVGSSWTDQDLSGMDVHDVDDETRDSLRDAPEDTLVVTSPVPSTPEELFDED